MVTIGLTVEFCEYVYIIILNNTDSAIDTGIYIDYYRDNIFKLINN